MGEKLGFVVVIDRTPKCHPEVAGMGIEYTWAQSKMYMRNIPWKLRKRKKNFHEYVRLSISTTSGAKLTKKRIRKFAARARDYIAAYYVLDKDNTDETNAVHTKISKRDIDKMHNAYRTHRSIERLESARTAADAAAPFSKIKADH